MQPTDSFDYGKHIEKIQEDWFTRKEPYEYERTVRLCGNRIMEIRPVQGRLVASWGNLTDYDSKDDKLPF